MSDTYVSPDPSVAEELVKQTERAVKAELELESLIDRLRVSESRVRDLEQLLAIVQDKRVVVAVREGLGRALEYLRDAVAEVTEASALAAK